MKYIGTVEFHWVDFDPLNFKCPYIKLLVLLGGIRGHQIRSKLETGGTF
jgi:hypothetical protein